MKSFSEKYGYKAASTVLQLDGMSGDLRTGLWNAVSVTYWHGISLDRYVRDLPFSVVLSHLWVSHYKRPIDDMPTWWAEFHPMIKEEFFQCDWNEVFDLVQFLAVNDNFRSNQLIERCNFTLELEFSGYRFIGSEIAPITSVSEKLAIEEAIAGHEKIRGVADHLQTALDHLSRKKSPDYRNSVKESISAVESIASAICGKKSTLSDALKHLGAKVDMHPALVLGLEKIYAYTSDSSGIRHALMDDSKLSQADAKFMLVSCSAFVNFLTEKALKAGVKLS